MKQQGFSLLEVLLWLIIFSVSLLAAFAVQIESQRHYQANHWQLIALQELEFAAAALRAGDSSQFIKPWQSIVAAELPQGQGSIFQDHGLTHIRISFWDKLTQQKQEVDYTVRK